MLEPEGFNMSWLPTFERSEHGAEGDYDRLKPRNEAAICRGRPERPAPANPNDARNPPK
jgi:hypothetical protein